jgi:Xaa-Pro aminopeptidase
VTRADRLAELIAERDLDALLVSDLANIRYLSGFTGTNALCLVGGERRLFLTDFRYVTQAAAQVDGFERAEGRQDLLREAAAPMAGRVGFDDAHLSVRQHRRLSELAPDGVELVPAAGLVEQLRAVKEPAELDAIRASAALTDDILAYVVDRGLVGHSEREVAIDLEREMRVRGGDPSFPTIVASGPHGALPHAEPRDVDIVANVLVTVDLGAIVDGYCSDCTRTFATGPLPAEAAEVYQLVHETQGRALGEVRAGASGKEVDAAARKLIADAGHGDHFGHGLGHGVGLEIHEGPRLSPLSEDTLAAGNVVTVEPGVYVPRQHGVRIEDLVIVADGECEVVSGFSKTLIVVE